MVKVKITLLFLLMAVFFAPGCKTTIVNSEGTIGATYSMGTLKAAMAKDIDAVYNASIMSAEELGLVVSKKMKDSLSAEIVARDSQDKKVTINLLATPDKKTDLSIHVGTMGSETKSQLIYQKIQEKLR